MATYEASNIEEAVEMAYKFKSEGTYDLFRGQTGLWPPHSSSYRIGYARDKEKEDIMLQRHVMFAKWIDRTPELQYLMKEESMHDLIAIMQHYGIPTHYIDFTEDPGVAGFFSADTQHPRVGEMACIYCLDSADLLSFWKGFKELDERAGAHLELVRVNVANLWRLQSQKGVFLYCDYNWEIDYPMDKIIFPYSGYPSYPTRDLIYPDHKSPIEQLLDHYFDLEQSAFAQKKIVDWIKEAKAKGRNAEILAHEKFPDGYHAPAFIDNSLRDLQSWNENLLQLWNAIPVENYHTTVGKTIKLNINKDADSVGIQQAVSFGVMQMLRTNNELRTKSIDWTFSSLPEAISKEELGKKFSLAWDGMRRLPFTDEDIANALSSLSLLMLNNVHKAGTSGMKESIFSTIWGTCMEVGFANFDNSGSKAFAPKEKLKSILRVDMQALLQPDFKSYPDDIYDLFKIIYNPRLMFDFTAFKKLFVNYIIPAQIATGRQLVLFNPVKLITFGIP